MSRVFITIFLIIFILHEIVVFYLLSTKEREIRGMEAEIRRVEREASVRESRLRQEIKDVRTEFDKVQKENQILRDKQRILDTIEEFNPGLSQQEKTSLGHVIWEESGRYGYDPVILMAIILTESSFQLDASSKKGAQGLMQILPSVGEELLPEVGKTHGIEISSADELMDPDVNVKVGSYYLFKLILRFGDLKTAIRAYNEGPSDISRRLLRGRPMPQFYYQRVVQNYQVLKALISRKNEDLNQELSPKIALSRPGADSAEEERPTPKFEGVAGRGKA